MAGAWKSARFWHSWGGLLLALPMLIVGITAVFIAHDRALGTQGVVLADAGKRAPAPEVKAVALLPDGSTLLGTKYGLWQLHDGQAPRQLLPMIEVRDLLVSGPRVWLAAKDGVWLGENGHYRQISNADSWQLTRLNAGQLLLSSKDGGPQLLDEASATLQPATALQAQLRQLPAQAEPYTLHKLVMDLHTGKFFFGKQGEWIWIDVLGIALVIFGLTGVWLWAKARRRPA